MKKILIVGSVASGKTTLAKRLSKQLHIPWFELDAIVHHRTSAGRYKRTAEEQMEVIEEIDRRETWIFEGTDRASYQALYRMADTIVFLDTPLWKRKIRIMTRYIKQILGIEKCEYEPDLAMLKMMYQWTRDFELNRSGFDAKLKRYDEKVIRLRNSKHQII